MIDLVPSEYDDPDFLQLTQRIVEWRRQDTSGA